jgi:hypothetical protein
MLIFARKPFDPSILTAGDEVAATAAPPALRYSFGLFSSFIHGQETLNFAASMLFP